MATLTMDAQKNLHLEQNEQFFCGERAVDTLTIRADRFYGTLDLACYEMRLCFALCATGEYMILGNVTVQEDTISTRCPLPVNVSTQAGIYLVWLEFWEKSSNARVLYSACAPLVIRAHRQASTLFAEKELDYLSQSREEMYARLEEIQAQYTQLAQEDEAQKSTLKQMQTDLENCVKNGDFDLRLGSKLRIEHNGSNGMLIQPYAGGSSGNNTSGQELTLTYGYQNKNNGWASFAGGSANHTTQSQQFVMGNHNLLPPSKNMAVVGQYCISRMEDAEGVPIAGDQNSKRPLFAVGNGTNEQNKSNAFTVYADGEAVLSQNGQRLLLFQNAKEQAGQIESLFELYHQLVIEQQPSHSLCLEREDPLCEDLPYANHTRPDTGKQITDESFLARLNAYLSARAQQEDLPLYLDLACTESAKIRSDPGKERIWFETSNLSLYVTHTESEGVQGAWLSVGNLLEAEGSDPRHSDYLRMDLCIGAYAETPQTNGIVVQTSAPVVCALGETLSAVKKAGKRIRGLNLTYVPYPNATSIATLFFPWDAEKCTGQYTISSPFVSGVSLQGGGDEVTLQVAPSAFGVEKWYVQTPDGDGFLFVTLELCKR